MFISPSSSSVFCQIGSDSSAICSRISGTSGTGRSLVLARMNWAGSMAADSISYRLAAQGRSRYK